MPSLSASFRPVYPHSVSHRPELSRFLQSTRELVLRFFNHSQQVCLRFGWRIVAVKALA